ncbi:hypothetical protein LLG34_04165 [bacterium]|nr:hypothetical protein [bacterium]
MRKVFFCCLFLIICSCSIFAQPLLHPYNLDFGFSENGSIPVGWRITDNDKKLGYIAYSTDSLSSNHYFNLKISFSKNRSIITQNENIEEAKEMRGVVYQTFLSDWFKGKNVKFSAKVSYKSQNPNDYLFLIIQNESPSKKLYQVKYSDTIKNANNDNFSVIAHIDTNSDIIRIGFALYGNSEAIIQDCSFEPVYDASLSSPEVKLTPINLQNLKLLSHIYGVAKYFYPDSNLNFQFWENFLYKNVKDAIKIQNRDDYLSKLKDDYSKVVNNFSIIKTNEQNKFTVISQPINSRDTSNELYNCMYTGGVSFLQTDLINKKTWNIYQSQRNAPGTAIQILNIRDKNITEISISAKVRFIPSSPAGKAVVGVRFDDPNHVDLLDLSSSIITDTTEIWKDLSIKTRIPENTATIRLGLILSGDGIANFDNIQIIAKDANNQIVPLELRNADFEDPLIAQAISAWLFPNFCADAGYSIELDSANISNGKYSLKISSDANFVRFFPPKTLYTEVFDGTEFTIPIQENVFLDKNNINFISQNNSFSLNSEDAISRICVAIDLWNIYRHFNLSKIDGASFEEVLEFALKNSSESSNEMNFRSTLERIAQKANDNSFKIWNGQDKTLYFPPFNLIYENNKFYVYSEDTTVIQNGCEALEIDDIELRKLNQDNIGVNSSDSKDITKSNANQNFELNRAILKMLAGNKNSQIKIKYVLPQSNKTKVTNLIRKSTRLPDLKKPFFSSEIDTGLIYIDATKITDKEFKGIIPELEKSDIKGIIFDFRGYSLLSEYILGLFSSEEIKGGSTIIPQYTLPLQLNIQNKVLNSQITPLQKLASKKVVFLMNTETNSYSEFILMLAKSNKVGTIIGTPSHGNFTESNRIMLPAYYFATMSGQQFGSTVGIDTNSQLQPDIEVKNNLESYLHNEDTQMKAAIDYLKKQR